MTQKRDRYGQTDKDVHAAHTSTPTHLAILPILPGGPRSCKTVTCYRMYTVNVRGEGGVGSSASERYSANHSCSVTSSVADGIYRGRHMLSVSVQKTGTITTTNISINAVFKGLHYNVVIRAKYINSYNTSALMQLFFPSILKCTVQQTWALYLKFSVIVV